MRDVPAVLDAITGRLLETMFFTTVLEQDGPAPEAPCYTAALAFSGSREGLVMVSASVRTAEALSANLLGESGDGVTPAQAASTVGELANILCGSLLGALEPEGRFVIGPPSVSASAEAAAGLETLPVRRVYVLDEGALAVAVSFTGAPSRWAAGLGF